jgi:hypothetical protein
MTEQILMTQFELSSRWKLSQRTLERWRILGSGPVYVKLGGSVRYMLEEVIGYETSRARHCASE